MKRRTRICLLINSICSSYSASIIAGVSRYCQEHDCVQFVFPIVRGSNIYHYNYQCDAVLKLIKEQNIDVLIIASASLSNNRPWEELFKDLDALPNVKKVSLGLELPGMPSVIVDDRLALEQLLNHLIKDHKRKNFLFIKADSKSGEALERERIFKRILKENNLTLPIENEILGNYVLDDAFLACNEFLSTHTKKDFDAVFCVNDESALGCISSLENHGIHVPEDVSVVGYDNSNFSLAYDIKLSTVDQEIEKQAYEAARVAESFSQNKSPAVSITKVNASLVLRESCGCPKVRKILTEEELKADRKKLLDKINFQNSRQLYMIHYFLLESQSPVSIENFYNRLAHCFSLFGIMGANLVLFNKPVYSESSADFEIPTNSTLEMTYSSAEGISRPQLKFNSKERMLPKEFLEKLDGTFILFPVYAETYQYGYFLMKTGKYENVFYQTIFELISKELVTSIKLTKADAERDKLKDKTIRLEKKSGELSQLSRTDEMTKLLNRRGFYEEAQAIIDDCGMKNDKGLVIFCDMDRLKTINDTFGHKAGDRAIIAGAEVLKEVFRNGDIVGRIGGDEFAVVAPRMKIEEFPKIKERLKEKCQEFNDTNQETFVLSLSVGCIQFDKKEINLSVLLNLADQKLYIEKRSKKAVRLD